MQNDSFIEISPKDFTSLKGSLELEKSKSIANRALVLQALSKNSFSVSDPGESDDVKVMIKALNSENERINCGLAGTVLRFLTAAFCLLPGIRIIDAQPALRKRPIRPLIDALLALGAKINYLENEGYLPIRIVGSELAGGQIEIEQNISSQFVSALMMIGPFMKNGLAIHRKGVLKSESYVELTQEVMKDLSLYVEVKRDTITLYPSHVSQRVYEIESDWSSAVYWMAFVCLVPHSKLRLLGLFHDSKQGDKKLLAILSKFGLLYKWSKNELLLSSEPIIPSHFECDCSSFPDQAQTLAFLCASLNVSCKLTGLETLVFKETNRIEALYLELKKLGIDCHYTDSSLSFSGIITSKEMSIDTYDDHRMAMAASLLGVHNKVRINNAAVVSKSYPNFWSDLKLLTT